MRKCIKCNEMKNVDEFYNINGRVCTICYSKRVRQWAINNKEKTRESEIKYYLKNREIILKKDKNKQNKVTKEEITIKQCKICKKEKDIKEFFRGRRECKICHNERCRQYKLRNPDKVKEYTKKNKERIAIKERKRIYNITEEEYQKLLKDTNGECTICKRKLNKPNIDHCHQTGKVRNILCNKCNTTLGFVDERIEILQAMIEYLKDHGKMLINTKQYEGNNYASFIA